MLNTLLSMGQYSADKASAEAQEKLKKYRNAMTNISNAINQNAITTNTTLAIQQSSRKAVYMRREELSTLGSTAVAAAAAGVRGNSVTDTLVDVQRNAGLMEKSRSEDLQQYFLQQKQQRLSSSLSAVQNQDLSYIPKPSLGMYMLKGITADAAMIMGAGGMPEWGQTGDGQINMADYADSGARSDIKLYDSGGYGPYRF